MCEGVSQKDLTVLEVHDTAAGKQVRTTGHTRPKCVCAYTKSMLLNPFPWKCGVSFAEFATEREGSGLTSKVADSTTCLD